MIKTLGKKYYTHVLFCSVLQSVTECCSVLQFVCAQDVLQCVAFIASCSSFWSNSWMNLLTYTVLQCVIVCYSALRCVAMYWRYVAVCCSPCFLLLLMRWLLNEHPHTYWVTVRYSVLQCAAVCCSVLQSVEVWCSVLLCIIVCRSVLLCMQGVVQCVAVIAPCSFAEVTLE